MSHLRLEFSLSHHLPLSVFLENTALLTFLVLCVHSHSDTSWLWQHREMEGQTALCAAASALDLPHPVDVLFLLGVVTSFLLS
jgi:hypothetical protein